jgi:hypothetical protein
MINRSVDVCWKEQHKYHSPDTSSESSPLWQEETDSDCELQSPRQVHQKHPFRDPRRQHLRHRFRFDEVSNARENEQDAKPDRGGTPSVEVTTRDGR